MSRSYESYVTLDMQIIYLLANRLVRSIVHLRWHVRYLVGAQRFTANFLMVVSPAVLAHDVSARASDVSMGIAVFPIGWI